MIISEWNLHQKKKSLNEFISKFVKLLLIAFMRDNNLLLNANFAALFNQHNDIFIGKAIHLSNFLLQILKIKLHSIQKNQNRFISRSQRNKLIIRVAILNILLHFKRHKRMYKKRLSLNFNIIPKNQKRSPLLKYNLSKNIFLRISLSLFVFLDLIIFLRVALNTGLFFTNSTLRKVFVDTKEELFVIFFELFE